MDQSRAITGELRLGFGAAGVWGKRWFSERNARRLVGQAVDAGIVHFDTAGFYAGGEAERRLGAALGEIRAGSVFVSTKTGTRYDRFGRPVKDFTETGIRADVEASLARLGRERLDLIYLHGPTANEIDATAQILSRLKQEGKIDRAGVCGEGAALDHAVACGAIDVIMGVYNLFRREHGAVFAEAKRKGVATVAIAPLAQGLYRRGMFAPASFADAWRLARAIVKNRPEMARARKARGVLESIDGWTPAQAALGFTLANPDIDVAIMATTKPENLALNINAASRWMPPGDLTALKGIGAPSASLDANEAGA